MSDPSRLWLAYCPDLIRCYALLGIARMTDDERLPETIRTLPRAIAWWAQRTPHAPALEAPGWKSASYAQLRQTIDRLRSELHAAGIGRGMRVALLLPDGLPLTLVSLAAISTATAATLDAELREPERDQLLAQLRIDALITSNPVNVPGRSGSGPTRILAVHGTGGPRIEDVHVVGEPGLEPVTGPGHGPKTPRTYSTPLARRASRRLLLTSTTPT